MIDLRSDTVTRPTPGMLDAMMSAGVGDDVFGEDPSITALEKKLANLFGMDHGIFCPSGTMTNQIALRILTQPYNEVICYEGSHIYKYEGGGMAGNSGLSARLIKGDRGKITAEEIKPLINGDDVHFPASTLISLENTVNKGGGSYYTLSEIEKISGLAHEEGLKLHLDGARLFNALEESKDSTTEYGKHFDTISICLSKGLGAPVGSVLLCKAEYAKMARRTRKVLGGGMRQAGYLAAAGIYALDHHVGRLKDDHDKAKWIGKTLEACSWVEKVEPVDTNIVIFKVAEHLNSSSVLDFLKQKGILAVAFGPMEIRFVTHLDFSETDLDKTLEIIKNVQL